MTTWALFECVFYKFAAPCGRLFERSCGHFGSQQASYRRNRRGSAICKKRFQKCGVSPCILLNIFSYFLSDSYNGTLFKSLHSVYVKRYWLISFGFVDRRWKSLNSTDLLECLWSIITLLSVWKFPILQPILSSIHIYLNFPILWIVHTLDFRYMIKHR